MAVECPGFNVQWGAKSVVNNYSINTIQLAFYLCVYKNFNPENNSKLAKDFTWTRELILKMAKNRLKEIKNLDSIITTFFDNDNFGPLTSECNYLACRLMEAMWPKYSWYKPLQLNEFNQVWFNQLNSVINN